MSGYAPCTCRDCFETAMGGLCNDCEEAGCDGECGQPGAYSVGEHDDAGTRLLADAAREAGALDWSDRDFAHEQPKRAEEMSEYVGWLADNPGD